MKTRPTLVVSAIMPRQKQTLADQLVLGLVTGGFLGRGMSIDGRESSCIRFVRVGDWFEGGPDRGELLLSSTESGETAVECRVWCRGLGARRLLQAALVGAGLSTLGAFGFGWLVSWSVPTGCVAAAIWDAWVRRSDRRRLKRQMLAFIHNTTYLKTV